MVGTMTPRELTNRRLRELEVVLEGYKPRTAANRSLLSRLSRQVLAAIDVRDLKDTSAEDFVRGIEHVLATVSVRKSGEANVTVRASEHSVVVETCVDDQPFLVSALQALMRSEQIDIRSSLNAVLRLRRDRRGVLVAFEEGTHESIVRIEGKLPEGGLDEGFEARVRARLQVAQAMVRDFKKMTRRIQEVADDYATASAQSTGEASVMRREIEGMLRWLCAENFVVFSVEEVELDAKRTAAMGAAAITDSGVHEEMVTRALADTGRSVTFHRSQLESPVHRAGKPGHFVVATVDRGGERTGALVVTGLFTYRALHTPPEEIPHLRLALRDMVADRDVSVDSHRGKSITNAFNSLPLEYLLIAPREQIWDLTDRILRAEEEGGTEVQVRIDEDRHYAFVFVALPREQFSAELRLEVQQLLLDELGASYADYGVYVDRYDNAIIHYYVTAPERLPESDVTAIGEKVRELARSWPERLRAALVECTDPEETDELFQLYVGAFNEEHRRRAAGERLVGDLKCLGRVRRGSDLEFDLFVSKTGDHPNSLNLRVFTTRAMTLSKQLPLIGSFGFEVVDEYVRDVRLPDRPIVTMHNFRLDVRRRDLSRTLGQREHVIGALRDVYRGQLGRDVLNRLVAMTNIGARDVEILRAYVSYLHQLRISYDGELIRNHLADHPAVAECLVAYLRARFHPDTEAREHAQPLASRLDAELRSIRDFTADRVLNLVAEAVRATTRTNAFAVRPADGDAFAFKIATRRISFAPDPKPFREIWVYHQEFEGVHLRGGEVARGGLRFSDRPDDFRTEILGLMATQMVKNVLIVPMGAKGGFVLRQPPSGRQALRRAGDAVYARFIRALLSITDNVVEGEVRPPVGVVNAGSPDPYLVVAADKGTAHLSDTANAISQEGSFWMDDAFASGGSNGYDHKATGITARGAWETTKRCFRELGIDPERDVITAIGVGDMSGDVFGNGLLRTQTAKLLGAFNHMHIFIDPDPDPAVSYAERKRVFEMGRSTWEDYDSSKISDGGGIYSRTAKEVPLSAKARALLGIEPEARVSGEAVIRALMCIEVDLFWMGGIGTYVKSRDESNSEVGDKANDSVRVNARQLKCRVFAEGANLSITDRGRVELAARAGALNYTAFLDNSGGVDTSDHEVNIKILFAPLLASGAATRDARNEVLREVEDEVCSIVLDNNRSQSRLVSYDVVRSREDLWRYQRTQQHLAQHVPFDPDTYAMPREEDLAARVRRGRGLHKCEAAVLASHAKMLAYRDLLADEPLPEALIERMFTDYFPERILSAAGPEAAVGHLLRREIATTMLVNRIVDDAGATLFPELATVTGKSTREIALAYVAARDFVGAAPLLDELYALEDETNQHAVYEAMHVVQSALEDATFYLLGPVAGGPLDAEIEAGRSLMDEVVTHLPAEMGASLDRRAEELTEQGIPAALAAKLVRLDYARVLLDVFRLARDLDMTPEETLRLRVSVASAMRLPKLQRVIARMKLQSAWDGPALHSLSRQLEFHVHKMVHMVRDEDVEGMIERFRLNTVREQLQQFLSGEPSIAGVVVLDGQLRRLLPPKTGIN
jgi:glutamate dehydrogenase